MKFLALIAVATALTIDLDRGLDEDNTAWDNAHARYQAALVAENAAQGQYYSARSFLRGKELNMKREIRETIEQETKMKAAQAVAIAKREDLFNAVHAVHKAIESYADAQEGLVYHR